VYTNLRALTLTLLALTWLLVHSAQTVATPAGAANAEGIVELKWDDLIPPDYNPYAILDKYDIDSIIDGSPEAEKMMEEVRASLSMAPVVKDLDGKTVKLPGFVVPLQHDGEKVSEFLLVPYFGACIHVPPPPSNQTIYVISDEGSADKRELFDTVWVTGELSTKWTGNELGDAGYTIRASKIVPYEE
jgi:hypothetical protein